LNQSFIDRGLDPSLLDQYPVMAGIQSKLRELDLAIDHYTEKLITLHELVEKLVFPDSEAIMHFRRNAVEELIFLDKLLRTALRVLMEPGADDMEIPYAFSFTNRVRPYLPKFIVKSSRSFWLDQYKIKEPDNGNITYKEKKFKNFSLYEGGTIYQ